MRMGKPLTGKRLFRVRALSAAQPIVVPVFRADHPVFGGEPKKIGRKLGNGLGQPRQIIGGGGDSSPPMEQIDVSVLTDAVILRRRADSVHASAISVAVILKPIP